MKHPTAFTVEQLPLPPLEYVKQLFDSVISSYIIGASEIDASMRKQVYRSIVISFAKVDIDLLPPNAQLGAEDIYTISINAMTRSGFVFL